MIKEDWCSYAIGQDLSSRSRLHTIFASENDGDFKKVIPKNGRDQQLRVRFSRAKELIRRRHRIAMRFGRKSTKNGESGA